MLEYSVVANFIQIPQARHQQAAVVRPVVCRVKLPHFADHAMYEAPATALVSNGQARLVVKQTDGVFVCGAADELYTELEGFADFFQAGEGIYGETTSAGGKVEPGLIGAGLHVTSNSFEKNVGTAFDHLSNTPAMPGCVMKPHGGNSVDEHFAAAFDILPGIGAATVTMNAGITHAERRASVYADVSGALCRRARDVVVATTVSV